MRVVLDTNVLVRATKNATGPARELLGLLQAEEHVIVILREILVELVRVLDYPRLVAQHRLTPEERQEFATSLDAAAEHVTLPSGTPAAVSSDPDDNFVVQTGVAGHVDVICTRDRHLLHLNVQAYCAGFGIRVLRDTDLLDELRQSAADDDAAGA
ncbi:MAG TPA: putative toxin-antitoxin system toxin component, PIN family [Pirellulales bacterium]|nr:putative toxin-antitoxin system toxin component, PIN family [Pirellulales bacterium]